MPVGGERAADVARPQGETAGGMRRRASDRCPLAEIVGQIERAFSSGEFALTAELLGQYTLQAWYGLPPERLRELLGRLVREGVANGNVRSLYSFLAASESEAPEAPDAGATAGNTDSVSDTITLVTHMFHLRLSGRPVQAARVSSELSAATGGVQPLFDSRGGWGLFSAVQHGITAMLAGDFVAAQASLLRAQLHPTVPSLAFLTRDGLVKSAVLHALYGDPDQARLLLAEARKVRRTVSWVEGVIDATAAIAAACVEAETPQDSLTMLESIPLREVGEMWPFYVVAVHRALTAADARSEAERRVQLFESMPLPRTQGEGFSGSVLELIAALGAMSHRNLAEARELLARADGSIGLTCLVTGVMDLVAGRPRQALQQMVKVREQTEGLRLLEVWRLAVMAGSHHALSEEEDCAAVLTHALRLPGGLRAEEALHFSAEVREFAEARVSGWPVSERGVFSFFDQFPPPSEILSAREVDVLAELARGLSREEIAKSQFISMNTLKAHLRSVYRKLGVNSRAAAVLEAERRGLV